MLIAGSGVASSEADYSKEAIESKGSKDPNLEVSNVARIVDQGPVAAQAGSVASGAGTGKIAECRVFRQSKIAAFEV